MCKDTGCLIPLRFSTPTGEFKDSYFGEDIKRSEEARKREIEEKENVLYADSERILSSLCKEVMLIATIPLLLPFSHSVFPCMLSGKQICTSSTRNFYVQLDNMQQSHKD